MRGLAHNQNVDVAIASELTLRGRTENKHDVIRPDLAAHCQKNGRHVHDKGCVSIVPAMLDRVARLLAYWLHILQRCSALAKATQPQTAAPETLLRKQDSDGQTIKDLPVLDRNFSNTKPSVRRYSATAAAAVGIYFRPTFENSILRAGPNPALTYQPADDVRLCLGALAQPDKRQPFRSRVEYVHRQRRRRGDECALSCDHPGTVLNGFDRTRSSLTTDPVELRASCASESERPCFRPRCGGRLIALS